MTIIKGIGNGLKYSFAIILTIIVMVVACNRAVAQDVMPLRTWCNDTIAFAPGEFQISKVAHSVNNNRTIQFPKVPAGLLFQDYQIKAKVDEIIDGDTYWVVVQMPSLPSDGNYKDWEYHRLKVRLWKCDTHESNVKTRKFKGWSRKDKLAERRKGLAAKKFAYEQLYGANITLIYRDKYRDNRWVCTVLCSDGETMKMKLKRAGHLSGLYE